MKNSVVEVNGYEFSVNEETGTTTVRGELQSEAAERNSYMQTKAGGAARAATDQGGHLVAAQANGPAISQNLFAQDGRLNMGAYKTVENAEQRLLADGTKIQTERTAYMSGPQSKTGKRPDAFLVNDTITYADGKTQEVHLSFANMTQAEQENINQSLNMHSDMLDMPNPGDALRNSMSSAEYANLMEETEVGVSSIRDEFDQHYSVSTQMETEAEWGFDAAEVSDEVGADIGGADDGLGTSPDND